MPGRFRAWGTTHRPALLGSVWGEIRNSETGRRVRINQLKQVLDQRTLGQADLGRGRAVYERVCGTCHKLHGGGG